MNNNIRLSIPKQYQHNRERERERETGKNTRKTGARGK
jgi:hypothetical protein